jgi:DNA-binding NarL/FixJ family response regulator
MNTILPRPIQVFLVAPAMLCWGLERLVQTAHPRMELKGAALTLAEAQPSFGDVDILILDLDSGYGPDVVADLQSALRMRLVVLTSSQDVALLDQMVVAGARGIVRKSDAPAALLKAIERVHDGELWIERTATGRIFVEMARRNAARATDPDRMKIATLTTRERQTIAAVASDAAAPGKVIAERLCISEHTFRNHLSSIYGKLGLSNRVDLYVYALRHRLHNAA